MARWAITGRSTQARAVVAPSTSWPLMGPGRRVLIHRRHRVDPGNVPQRHRYPAQCRCGSARQSGTTGCTQTPLVRDEPTSLTTAAAAGSSARAIPAGGWHSRQLRQRPPSVSELVQRNPQLHREPPRPRQDHKKSHPLPPRFRRPRALPHPPRRPLHARNPHPTPITVSRSDSTGHQPRNPALTRGKSVDSG